MGQEFSWQVEQSNPDYTYKTGGYKQMEVHNSSKSDSLIKVVIDDSYYHDCQPGDTENYSLPDKKDYYIKIEKFGGSSTPGCCSGWCRLS